TALGTEVNAGRRAGNLGDQLRAAFDVAASVERYLAAALGFNEERGVGLRLVFEVEVERAVVTPLDPRRQRVVRAQPGHQSRMRPAVPPLTHGRWHVDHSVDELGLLDLGHRLVAAS